MTKHYKHNIILFLLAINSQKFALGETPWLKDALPCWRSLCFLIITIAMLLTGPHAMPVDHLVHLVIYRKCYRFERPFFTLRCFFTGSQQLTLLAGLHADLRNIAPARLFVWIITIQKLHDLNDSVLKPTILKKSYLWWIF